MPAEYKDIAQFILNNGIMGYLLFWILRNVPGFVFSLRQAIENMSSDINQQTKSVILLTIAIDINRTSIKEQGEKLLAEMEAIKAERDKLKNQPTNK